jgi:type II secretory pathway predicted ATPase ExeA
MFIPFFGFSAHPFVRDLPPEQRFKAPPLDELHARLSLVTETCGTGLFTSEPGCGKSTGLRRLRDELHPERTRAVYLSDTSVHTSDLYRALALELGVAPAWSRAATLRAIKAEIERLYKTRRQSVLLVLDEAHKLRNDVLAEVPVLTNFEWDGVPRLAVLLVGLPGLAGRLRLSVLEPLAQRVTLRYALRPLDRDTSRAYLEHRLRTAGADRPLFTEPAFEALYGAAQGVMRRIDVLATHALAAAAGARARLVDTDHTRLAIEETRP